MPAPVDADLAAFVAGLPSDVLDDELAAILVAWAERAATLALRASSSEPVRQGLLAVAHAWLACPEIEHAVVSLGVLYDVAARVGDAARLFADVGAVVGGDAQKALRDFLTRPDLAMIAAEMGFIEVAEPDGPRFYRTW